MDHEAQPKHEVHPTDEAVRTATVGDVPLSRLRKIHWAWTGSATVKANENPPGTGNAEVSLKRGGRKRVQGLR
jgi:hypothetical protein